MTTKIEALTARVAMLTARIAKDTAELDALKAAVAAQEAVLSVSPGDLVAFNFGRADTRTVLTGEVEAVADERIRVRIGAGFDAELKTIYKRDVVSVNGVGAEVRDSSEQVAAVGEEQPVCEQDGGIPAVQLVGGAIL